MIATTRLVSLVVLATSLLGPGAASALAQGTPEQREACTPDALRVCADTIPDIGRTTACMRAHRSELSSRCQAVLDGGPAKVPTQVARREPPARAEAMRHTGGARMQRRDRMAALAPGRPVHRHVALRGDRDTREARRVIGRLCGTNVLDAGTCGFMGKVLTLAE